MSFRRPSSTEKAGLVFAHDGDDSFYAVVLDRDADKIALHQITDGSWGSALGSDDVTINNSTDYTVKVRRKQRSVAASVGSAGFTYNSTSDFGTGQSGFYSDKTDVTFDDVVFYDGTSRDPKTPRISGLAQASVSSGKLDDNREGPTNRRGQSPGLHVGS